MPSILVEPERKRKVPCPSLPSDFVFLIKVARPGFWITAIWFYMLPLGQQFVFTSVPFWLGLLYVTFPLGLVLYGVNDLADAENDRMNPRKGTFLFGARGSHEQLAALPRYIILAQIPFILVFSSLFGTFRTLVWFLAVCAATALYNWPRIGTKNLPFVDIITQAGYLLVFVLSSWVNDVPQLPWYTFLFGALFAMHSHLLGQIMDIVPDRAAGRRTTAVVIGIVPSKLLMVGILATESWIVYHYTRDVLIGAALAFASVWILLDATVLWRERLYSRAQMRFFLFGWNAAAIVSLPLVWLWGRLCM